jgi:ADP-ribose pyrophosphatase
LANFAGKCSSMNLKSDNKSLHWRVLGSEYLHQEPWLTVRKEQLQLPNGNIAPEYYVLEYANWVNTIAITREKKFVLVKQYRHGIRQVCYELCAGVCENSDRSPLESAKRELMEETGYGKGKWSEFICVSPNASANTNLSYCFIAEDVERINDQALEDSEDLTVHLFSLDEVKELLMNGEIIQATMAAPLWKYMAVNKLL